MPSCTKTPATWSLKERRDRNTLVWLDFYSSELKSKILSQPQSRSSESQTHAGSMLGRREYGQVLHQLTQPQYTREGSSQYIHRGHRAYLLLFVDLWVRLRLFKDERFSTVFMLYHKGALAASLLVKHQLPTSSPASRASSRFCFSRSRFLSNSLFSFLATLKTPPVPDAHAAHEGSFRYRFSAQASQK